MAPSGDGIENPIAEKRRQRKLENQRLEAAARQRQEDLRLQKERELQRQEDERLAAEQRRRDEIERLRLERETERERIATIERTERHRILAIEATLKRIGAFCTHEIALTDRTDAVLPHCVAVLSPVSLEKPIAGIEQPLVFVGDAASRIGVYRLRDGDARCLLFRIVFEYDANDALNDRASVHVASLCTTRSGHLIVCNQHLGVVGAYDINQLLTLYHLAEATATPPMLDSRDHHVPVVRASSSLVATFVFPQSGSTTPSVAAPQLRSISMDDTASELFVSDQRRHCVHVLSLHAAAFQRDSTSAVASSTAAPSKRKPPMVLARSFGTKGHNRGELHKPAGLDVSHYHVLVCDRGNHRVVAFSKRGAFVCAFGSKGRAPGQFLDPTDVKLANVRKRALSRGLPTDDSSTAITTEQFEMLVADLGNFRVQVLNETGASLRVLSLLAGAEQIQFHQRFLGARHAHLLELYAAMDDNGSPPSLACDDLTDLFRLGEQLHPTCAAYQDIAKTVHAFRDDARRFHHPRALAYLPTERRIVVLDRQNAHLGVYNVDGSLSVWSPLPHASSSTSYGLSSAHSTVVLGDRVFVSDPLSHRVAVLHAPSLRFERFLGATTYGDQTRCAEGFLPGELRSPTYLAVYQAPRHDNTADPDPWRLLVADSGNHRVSIFDLSSSSDVAFCGTIGHGFGHLDGFFDSPQGLAVLANRWLFVCDQRNHRVQVFDLETLAFVRAIGREQGRDRGQFSFPLCVAVCGALLRVDRCDFGPFRDAKYIVGDTGNHRVQVLDALNDRVLYVVDARATPFDTALQPTAIACHAHSGYWVMADASSGSIAVFRHDGTFVAAFGRNLEPENCMERPTGVLLLVGSTSSSSQEIEHLVITDAARMALCTFEWPRAG